jgi:hypothetical protein
METSMSNQEDRPQKGSLPHGSSSETLAEEHLGQTVVAVATAGTPEVVVGPLRRKEEMAGTRRRR